MLDLYDPFEQDIMFNLTFEFECFLHSFFFFYNSKFHAIKFFVEGCKMTWKPNKTLKIMVEYITRETGYPAVIENTNIFVYKSSFINRQYTFNVFKKFKFL